MYGGSGKFGRGGGGGGRGGGGAGKRNNNIHSTVHQTPPLHRPSTASGGRLPVGGSAGPRNRNTTASGPSTSSTPSAVEETFSLVTGNPLDFAMIIWLAPNIVDEIKRVEAQGGTARIKFDSNANNSSGNVIDVGGKDFKFTWSREVGDLDIYEERQSGEDGNGLLVDSGCAWRKLNVQRILDESTKNHVKKRSEEAERQQKSRKAIILDHGNPSAKSQIKALAAAEVTAWRKPFKQKEPEFKKRKIETLPVGAPPKSSNRSGLLSTTPAKGGPSVSPLPSPPENSAAPASPFWTGNLIKVHNNIEDAVATQVTSKEKATSSDIEIPNRATSGAAREKPGRKWNLGAKPMDLQSMLIKLLMDHPKGMSLKAIEKAIGNTVPNSVKKIEPIIKKIATFQAPGRYFLKPEVELDNLKKPLSESGSSPEDNRHQTPALEDRRDDIPPPITNFADKATKELEKQAQLNLNIEEGFNSIEKNDAQHHSPDLFGDKKVSDNSEGPAASSSDSGSDSDSESDSSDSGSDSQSHSRSRSKSRSPRSGSGSSSDSESDASSNSKQGPDEDVDIMTSDDDKESGPNLHTSEPGLSTSPVPWRTSDGRPSQNGIDEKQDGNVSDIVEIEKDLPVDDHQTEMAVIADTVSSKDGEKPAGDTGLSSLIHQKHQKNQVYTGNLLSERENIAKDVFKREHANSSERIFKDKPKRGSDSKQPYEKSERAKRFKPGTLPRPETSQVKESLFLESPKKLSPDRVFEDRSSTQMINRARVNVGSGPSGVQKVHNQGIPSKSSLDSQNSGRRSADLSARNKASDIVDRLGMTQNLGSSTKFSERNRHSHEGLSTQKDKISREIQDDDFLSKEKKMPKNSKEGAFGVKPSTHFDSHSYGKHGQLGEKFKEAGEVSNSHMGYSPQDSNRIDVERSPLINGSDKTLQREFSDLELGELREPLPDETPAVKKEFERKSSFKQSENKTSFSDYWNSDLREGKPTGKTTLDSGKSSPSHLRVGTLSNSEGSSRRTSLGHHVEDFTRPHHKVVQSQPQGPQNIPRVDRHEVVNNKLADVSGKLRHNEARTSQGIGLEGYGDTHKKSSVSAPQQHDSKWGPVSHPQKESKTQKSNTLADLSDVRKDTSLTESNEGGVKRRESSSDENSCSYSKYEKEEPELKGPIKDFSQYKEYVQEYREKYDSYCSLNKTLESYRNEFDKLGRDLGTAKGRDMEKYYNILGQLKESYRLCGTGHKRLKKIFIVLHEELKHLKQMIKDYAVSYARE